MKTTWIPGVGVIMTVLLLSATMAQAVGTQLLVSNVQTQQRQFTATWDVTYDLETVGDIAVTVSLSLSTDSGASYPNLCATVTGDVGAGVLPGAGRHIAWNAGADFPGLSSSTCRLRLTADDGQEAPAGFVEIAPGTFVMGSPTTELLRDTSETQHQVTLTHGSYVQTTEVTNQQYRAMAQWAYDHGYVTATVGGLYDMHGNLHEWCNDLYYYAYGGTVTDPVGAGEGFNRVVRGGSCFTDAQFCRSAYRVSIYPDYTSYAVGFRPVRSAF